MKDELYCEKHKMKKIVKKKKVLPGFEKIMKDTLPPYCHKCEEEKRIKAEEEEKARQQVALKERLEKAGLKNRYKDASINKMKNQELAKLAKEFINKQTDVLIYGGIGTGKTYFGQALINFYKGIGIKHLTIVEMIRDIKSTYQFGNEQEKINSYSNIPILIIDELGIQFKSSTEYNYLTEIINNRYNNLLNTIIISNCLKTEIKELLGSRMLDRISEDEGKNVFIDGKSQRRQA